MPFQRIERSGRAPLEFQGEALCDFSTEIPGLKRWHELTLYKRVPPAQGFVARIVYRTLRKEETDLVHAVVANDAAELAKLLAAYGDGPDAVAGITGFYPGVGQDQRREVISQKTRNRLQEAIADALARVPGAVERLP